jgi:hypothetical protein
MPVSWLVSVTLALGTAPPRVAHRAQNLGGVELPVSKPAIRKHPINSVIFENLFIV